MVWALTLIPFVAVVATTAMRARRALLPVCLLGVTAVLATSVWGAFAAPPPTTWSWGPVLSLELELTGFGQVMAVLVPAVALPILAYAGATEEAGRLRLLALMTAFVGAMELLVTAADFLTLLVAWELVGALSWGLIGHGWRDADNSRAAAHAFLTTRFGDLGLYIAAGATLAGTGSLRFDSLARAGDTQLAVIALGVLLAASAKSAQLPFSPWLFSAMAGPTPVSSLLHSATMVAAGAYLLVRLAPVLETVWWFGPAAAVIGLATALAGGVVALTQTHAKRVLAGSTSAQYGLMFVAVGAGSTAAAGAHLVAHAFFKSLLFLGAGVAIHAVSKSSLGAMYLGRALPRVAALSGVGALALAAVPPLGGAWTKEEIIAATVHASPWLGVGVFVAAFLSALYAGRYHLLAFGPGRESFAGLRHPGRTEVGSLAVLATVSLALGVLWLPAAGEAFGRAIGGELAVSAPWEFAVSIGLVAVAGAVLWALARSKALESLGLPARMRRFAADWIGIPGAARVLIVNPVLELSRFLAHVDDRVIDAGVRGTAATASFVSRLFAWRGELTVDGAVRALAAGALLAAGGSRAADDRGVDVAVHSLAKGVGAAGRESRRTQTGLSHHYYLVVAGGLLILVGVLALAR